MPRLRRPRYPLHTARRAAAVVLAVVALVLAARPASPPEPPPAAVGVTVAAVDLPAGTVLAADRLTVARLPPELVPDGSTGDPSRLVGRVLAGGVRAGEPLTDVRLVGPGLTAQLPSGQMGAPVRLTDLAVAGLVRTGDRVDVLATPPGSASAEVVAAAALVLSAAAPSDPSDPASGLLLLAVDGATATRLAAAATSDTLTVSLPRQDTRGADGPQDGGVGG
jgi:pilus assembly protein CpaB